jgi:transcription initiation factor TFIID TATA-box-binding protein
MQKPIVVNIIALANLGTEIKLNSLTITECQFKYNPRKFNAAVIKCASPIKATALLWESGKMICLGTKNLINCENAIKIFIEIIQGSGCPGASYSGHTVENIVSTFKFGHEIELNEFRKNRRAFYEPEIFCGLNFKRGKSMTALIFWTGKVVITGTKNNSEIDEMYHYILPYLKIAQKNLKRR